MSRHRRLAFPSFAVLLVLASAAASAAERPRFEVTTDEAFDPSAVAPYAGDHAQIYARIDADIADHVASLQRWVRQRSISAENVGVTDMAEMFRADLEAMGFAEAEVVPTDGHPGVWGYYDAGAQKTLLLYMMYDVQPADPEDWRTPPFEGNLVETDLGTVLMARGATNQKGPQRALLNAMQSVIDVTGTLPVNVMILAEGEEEISSVNYPALVTRFEDRVSRADAVFFPFNSQDRTGAITMYLGVKGILYMEMEARGGPKGGPTRAEIHGSYKAIVDSPTWRLVQALASLTSEDGNTILVPNYYDAVRGPTEAEMRLVNGLARTWDAEANAQHMGVARWVDGLTGRDAILEYLYMPTLNIDGIWSGYTGEGSKTILPHVATAKVDSRLPPDLLPDEAQAMIRAHLDAKGFDDIEIRRLGGYPASQTAPDAEIVQAAISVYNKYGETREVWPRLAGSAPFYQFTDRLKLPFVFGGLGHGSGAHGPDEYMVIYPAEGSGIAGLAELEKGYVDFLHALAGR
jgi:acetylornithine deacetylase/succinyl-diaminopimelate desuccinylase-like protein